MYLWIYELDQRIERLGLLLDDLQPWAAGKLSIRFLYPKIAKDGEGRRRFGRRPEIVCWRSVISKDGSKKVRPGQLTSVTVYDLVKPRDAKQSLKRHTVFAETYAEAKHVLAVILDLMKQRDDLSKQISNANRRYTLTLLYSQRAVAEIDHKTEGWEEQVRAIADTARQGRKQRARAIRSGLELFEGYTHDWTPVKPSPSDIDPGRL